MKSSKFVPYNDEHTKRLLGVFHFGQEVRLKAEGEGDFSGLVEVGFENMFVEDQETLQDLKVLLVEHGTANFVVEFLVCKWLDKFETLIRQGGPE